MWGISILAEWGISFHAVVVFGLGKNLLFKSVLGRCGRLDCLDERGDWSWIPRPRENCRVNIRTAR